MRFIPGLMIVFCLFMAFPLCAQQEENAAHEIELLDIERQEAETQDIAQAIEPQAIEPQVAGPEEAENEFIAAEVEKIKPTGVCRLLSKDRWPLIETDNLIFGYPEFFDVGFGFDLGFNKVFYIDLGMRMDYTGGPFHLVADILFINDQKYAPAAVMNPSGSLGAFYFLLNEGGIKFNLGLLELWAGRFKNYDEVDSPYSLFINSNGISANTLKFRLESKYFVYQTQWIGLNWNNGVSSPAWNEYARRKVNGNDWLNSYYEPDGSRGDIAGLPYGFPDRGVNYKVYALKIKDWRLGFLDAAVYSGRPFDFEYLLSPIPMYFTQYFRTTAGRPWATESNDNCMMGFFWDINKEKWDAYAQALVDDFSLGFLRFIFKGMSRNPWKAAWALGGSIHTGIGTFGFHHGGALKYTFEPIPTGSGGRYDEDAAQVAYGYAYYPETRYYDGNRTVSLLIEDMMVGYKYGQNNLAFQVDYRNTFFGFLFRSELELVLAGNNSPANPYHDYDYRGSMYENGIPGSTGGYGSQLFNDGHVEKRFEWRINISRRIGQLSVYTALAFGGRFNKLELSAPGQDPNSSYTLDGVARTVDNDIWIWKATNTHEFIFRFSIGFRYTIPII